MLKELSIRHFAIIEHVQLSFEDGFHVLTGETGAGEIDIDRRPQLGRGWTSLRRLRAAR